MDNKARDYFIRQLNEISGMLTVVDFNSDDYLGNLLSQKYIIIGKNVGLLGDGIAQFEQLLEQIWTKLHCDGIFTKEWVDKELKDILVRIFEEGEQTNLPVFFDQLVGSIENFAIEQNIYLPLDNIEMSGDDVLELGRVKLKKMTDTRIQDVCRAIENVIMQTANTEEEKPQIIEHLHKYSINPLRNKICAEFSCVAQSDVAGERAEEEALRAIDLLRFAIPSIYTFLYPAEFYSPSEREKQKKKRQKSEYRTRTRVGVGLQGEVSVGIRRTVIIQTNVEAFSLPGKFVGMRPFEVSDLNRNTMEQIGALKVSAWLRQQTVTPFQDAILRSIHWFANALVQFEIENELLNLVTSLETLLARESDNLMEAVGYGIAFILGNNINERKELISRYNEIYKVRSSTSHHGYRRADEVDLIELRYLSMKIIKFAIEKSGEWEKPEELSAWIKEKKLG